MRYGMTNYRNLASKGGYWVGEAESETQIIDEDGFFISRTEDMQMPLVQGKQGQTDKPPFDFTAHGFLFPQADATQILYLTAQLPHGWEEGSIVYPHIHYRQSASTIPVFKIDYKWYNVGDAVPTGYTTYPLSTPMIPYQSGTISQINNNATGIDGTGKKVSSIMLIKLYRDDNVVTGTVIADQFDIHILKDSWGSREEYVK